MFRPSLLQAHCGQRATETTRHHVFTSFSVADEMHTLKQSCEQNTLGGLGRSSSMHFGHCSFPGLLHLQRNL